ncbi:FKBP-type peptidyl-prolyl cis-trans isomerase [Endozoicomonas ascidiicola]|uniref:FKBP-type peptidyl-prolyl cis-trans isomerase n=1 Tax=Endozoicomonas ascidiicola TaxID=1698521 RepID=UPI00082D3089|nr:peptidylprolyl isomerase [Endozoicomonas ascidiicola]
MKIAKERVALFHYTLKNDNGEVLDSSEGESPMAYIHGEYNIVEGLENALEGKQAGDKFEVSVESAEGYGEYDESLVQPVPKEQFGDHSVEVGQQFHADTAIGPRVVTVIAINDEEDQVVIDANHSLAGENLHFSVEVVEVREATKEELDHGHVHGPGGHEH